MERPRALVSILRDQWTRVWDMWEEMIHAIPDDEWRRGDIDYLIPVRHLVHVLVCDDAFSEDMPLDQYDDFKLLRYGNGEHLRRNCRTGKWRCPSWPKLGESWEKDLPNSMIRPPALLEPEKVHPWAGQTRMGKLLHVLRHSQHHLGEVSAELIRRGIKAAIWEKEKAAKLGLSPWW